MTLMASTEVTRFIRHGHACLGVSGPANSTLTASGHNDSLLWSCTSGQGSEKAPVWSPYGQGKAPDGLPGFNGERPDPVSGSYHLGNGYRAFNLVLSRFNCPDSLSPFGAGGINPYTYCAGDPVNHIDPTGHISWQGIAGITAGVIGLGLSLFTAGASLAAAGGIAASLSSAHATALVVGGLGIAADVTGIACGITEDSNPAASSVLGWVSMVTGIAGMATGLKAGLSFKAHEPQHLYRLDYRPPDIILKEGFTGTNNHYWINDVFEGNTVFTSRSLRGTSRFFLESVLNESVSGSKKTGALAGRRSLYPAGQKVYVYKINAALLKCIDVCQDLEHVLTNPSESKLYRYVEKAIPLRNSDHTPRDQQELAEDYRQLVQRLDRYRKNMAFHTEEVIVKGPVPPGLITLYQVL